MKRTHPHAIRLRSRVAATLALLAFAFVAAPATLAADVTDVGFVDQAKLASIKPFADANRQLATYKAELDRQFAGRMRGVRNPSDQQRIAGEFQNKLVQRQRSLFGPLFARAQVAVASVASSRNLSVVVDKQIIIVGGQDITGPVIDLVTGIGEPVPPVSTPPPSTVGYVDQTQIDALPAIKAAAADFQKFKAGEDQDAAAKF